MDTQTDITKIRPAARIISTIGEDLVGDAYAAVVELVKNAYDADANSIEIIFEYKNSQTREESLEIEIKDDGHGMSRETIINKWLVPATKDKVERQLSPKGRRFQGRKGIGRYAAAILGQELLLKTITENGEQTEVLIDWRQFEKEQYLDDIDIIVTTKNTKDAPGTIISIIAKDKKKTQWGRNELGILTKELRKLKSPFNQHSPTQFEIKLAFFNCPFEEYNDQIFEIEAFPIIELFDYRISGKISDSGIVSALYENNSEPNLPSAPYDFHIKLPDGLNYCGPVEFDFRVFDRDKEAIDNLINKGLIDPISKLVMGKREARQELDRAYGVNLYREGFRVRPYGNGGIDWLDLDKDRIQNPSFKVGNNQVVGFVNVKPEEISNLEEKSARDGLKESSFYFGLIYLLKSVLMRLEENRFNYRKQTGRGRRSQSIQNDLNELFNFETLTKQISKKLNFLKIEKETIDEIATIIQKEAEQKTKLLENIQNTIAIYQGQATLGKIVTVLLHEGRKPISYFKHQSSNLIKWLQHYKLSRNWDDEVYDSMINRLNNFKRQSEFVSQLFKRLDPLAKQNKGERKDFNLKKTILKSKAIFESFLRQNKISFDIECDNSLTIYGWEEDLIIAITNLIENSNYWLTQGDSKDKKITVMVVKDKDIIIHYKDNGPGIDEASIETGAIFEPGFSKKINGTGLGLPIAGEAIERLGGSIIAHYSEDGAYFTIELKV